MGCVLLEHRVDVAGVGSYQRWRIEGSHFRQRISGSWTTGRWVGAFHHTFCVGGHPQHGTYEQAEDLHVLEFGCGGSRSILVALPSGLMSKVLVGGSVLTYNKEAILHRISVTEAALCFMAVSAGGNALLVPNG